MAAGDRIIQAPCRGGAGIRAGPGDLRARVEGAVVQREFAHHPAVFTAGAGVDFAGRGGPVLAGLAAEAAQDRELTRRSLPAEGISEVAPELAALAHGFAAAVHPLATRLALKAPF